MTLMHLPASTVPTTAEPAQLPLAFALAACAVSFTR
jgi:hypothetical protein